MREQAGKDEGGLVHAAGGEGVSSNLWSSRKVGGAALWPGPGLYCLTPLPGQDHMCPFGIIEVATRYFATGARGELV